MKDTKNPLYFEKIFYVDSQVMKITVIIITCSAKYVIWCLRRWRELHSDFRLKLWVGCSLDSSLAKIIEESPTRVDPLTSMISDRSGPFFLSLAPHSFLSWEHRFKYLAVQHHGKLSLVCKWFFSWDSMLEKVTKMQTFHQKSLCANWVFYWFISWLKTIRFRPCQVAQWGNSN